MSIEPGAPRVSTVIASFVTSPWQAIVLRWNWKASCLSSAMRATIFFLVNLDAGTDAATRAFATEWCYRAVTAGFYGAMTQSFRHAAPRWQASLAAMVVIPATSHCLELVVHLVRGTPRLAASMAVSIALTMVSTAFHLDAMRNGVLIVGDGRRPILDDLRRLPRLWANLALTPFVVLRRLVRPAASATHAESTR